LNGETANAVCKLDERDSVVFKIGERDLLGRLGELHTRSGVIETPLMLPVINPNLQTISPRAMVDDFNCQALITNAYMLWKHWKAEVRSQGVHRFLTFNRPIMTDSGGYQILVYGDVDVDPVEIVRFQEDLDTDIGVILDVPTGWEASRSSAERSVEITLSRARQAVNAFTRDDILWVGPVQGGKHLDLVARSAKEVGALPFQIHALGSPTQVMERYLFDVLVDMVITAKQNLPQHRPLHLFGAGHPFMFSLAVALGCDLFDSAAYALAARAGKYLTAYGTVTLRSLDYFPCSCRTCTRYTPRDLQSLPVDEVTRLLASHNLEACYRELRRVKQALHEHRLWELLEIRARGHPSLLSAFRRFEKYKAYVEKHASTTRRRGIFYFGYEGLSRPEIVRHHRLLDTYQSEGRIHVLLPQPGAKPFSRSREFRRVRRRLRTNGVNPEHVRFCFYGAPFGVTPLELDAVHPLSQFEIAHPLDEATISSVVSRVIAYIASLEAHSTVVIHADHVLGERIVEASLARSVHLTLTTGKHEKVWSNRALDALAETINAGLRGADNESANRVG
jgi:7-cyano-7-deazaguanine tRNA-ribosyltransferase